MKAITWLVLLLALALLLGGCAIGGANAPTTPGLGLGPAPWKDGDRLEYNVLETATGVVTGTIHFGFSQQGEAWVISETDRIADLEQRLAMRVNAADLTPLGELKTIQFATTTAVITTNYTASKIDVRINVNGRPDSVSITVPSNVIDGDQTLMTLRALPFAQGYKASYVLIVAQNAQKTDLAITVQAQETVTVPADTFVAWRIELNFGGETQTVWYQVDAPHNMVQYDDGVNRLVLVRQ